MEEICINCKYFIHGRNICRRHSPCAGHADPTVVWNYWCGDYTPKAIAIPAQEQTGEGK